MTPKSPPARWPRKSLSPWLAAMAVLTSGAIAKADPISLGDITMSLGPAFFVDNASTGGGDSTVTQPAIASYNRSFAGLLNTNQGPTRLVLTGFGFASSSSTANNTATSLTVTFTYLGADEAVGGGDDVTIGSVTGTYTYNGAGEYVMAFASPLTMDLDITGTRFRIQVAPANATGDGKVLFKTGALTYESSNGPKFSVAGIIAPQRVNLAKFQTVTTSSVSGNLLATYLTDGDAGNENRWQSTGTGPHWARVTFPHPVEIGGAHVFTGVDDANAQANFQIQYLDGTTWLDAPGAVITGNTQVERDVPFTTPVTSTAFRIHSSDATLRVRELALFPPHAGGRPPGTDVRVNLAHQRPATATANTPGNFALLAVDGRVNEASKWQTSTVGTQSIEIDLRVSGKIGSAHVYTGSSGVPPLADFDLQSWDGTAWQTIPGAAITGNTSAARVIPFTTPVTTSRVRLVFTNPGTTSVREICIFPANDGNAGYPAGTGVSGLPPLAAKAEDYRDSFHIITNAAANQALAVSDGAPRLNPSGLALANRQYQLLLNLDNGTYRLRNRATGLCLSGPQLSTAPAAALIDAPYAALPDQDWILSRTSATQFCLVNAWSGLVVDTQGGATAPGTPLVQAVRNGSPTQSWQISYSTHALKKGVGGTNLATLLDARWAYNWGLAHSATLPSDCPFQPMQWGNFNWNFNTTSNSTWKSYSPWRQTGHPLHLLGFNEPDKFDQSGNSLDLENTNSADFSPTRSMQTAVALWPRLMAMDQPLVSPAPASATNGWLDDFFTQSNALGYRVDYTAVHNYPGPSGGSANNLINFLQNSYNTWGRPVWLTEFSFVNWSGTGTWTEEDNYNCLAEFLWRAESLPWLHKYALFVFREAGPDNPNNPPSPAPEFPWSPVGPRSNTIDIDGNLTAFGKLYAAWDGDATVRAGKPYFIHHKSTRKRLASNPGQSTAAARNIRNDSLITHWTLVPTGADNRYYLVSRNDGRRLSFTSGGNVVIDPAGTTGPAVEWSLTAAQHGWQYLNHPATSSRLRMAYNNSTSTATYTMVANTTTTDDVQWRFIVPVPPPVWTGAESTSWTQSTNWASNSVPASGDSVTFDTPSTANLATILNQDFTVDGLILKNPAANVSIGGTHTLTLGSGGIDLSTATRDLTLTAPITLSAAQHWIVAGNRTLGIGGTVSSASTLTIAGLGKVAMEAPNLLPNGSGAGSLIVNGTLDLNGTTQAANSITGSGTIDNTAPGTATLSVGNDDLLFTLSTLLQNTGGPLGLVKNSTGNLVIPQANTHSGGFTNHGSGNINPQHNTAFGNGPVVMNAGAIYATTGSFTFANPLTLAGATLRVGGANNRTITWTGPVAVTATSVIRCDGGTGGITVSGGIDIQATTLRSEPNGTTVTLTAPVTGSGTIITSEFSSGTLRLNAANPFTGTFRAQTGTLRIGHPGALQNGTLDLRGDDAGTVNLNNLDATIGALTGSRNLALGSGTITIGNNHADTTYGGAFTGSGSIVKTGGGTLTLTGSNTHAGATAIHSGTLALGADHVLPETPVSIGTATLDAATFTDALGPLDVTGNATIHLGGGAALAFANSGAVDWAGGALALTGTFVPGASLRFGTDATGLTATQLALISAPGITTFALNDQGYLTTAAITGYDAWKTQITNGLDARGQDADGDGFSNLHEFLFGTSPIAPNSSLTSTETSGTNLIIRWKELQTGATYTLLQSETLNHDWIPAAGVSVENDGAPAGGYQPRKATVAIGSDKRFYRIEGSED